MAAQTEFAAALLDADRALPAGLTSHSSPRPVRRFAVYRNNVVASLINALRTRFPATQRIVGDEFFAAMARVFVTQRPPRSIILHRYGDDFGDFIDSFGPAADLPYLADMARLEAARTRAYHAADATPLSAADLAATKYDDIGAMRFTLHPSLEILRSPHPVVTIWSMNAGEREIAPIEDAGAEDALVLRPHLQVLVQRLPPGGADFIAALQAGHSLAAAADHAMACDPGFDLAANLAGLIGAGAITNARATESVST